MFVALRSGLAARQSFAPISKELCKITSINNNNNNNLQQTATLMRAAYREESEIPLIKPFPYHRKEYNIFNMIMDTHKCRVHKHSKLIVLDGLPGLGKNKLAQELAKELDFLYLPQMSFDEAYISAWGWDMRSVDHLLPKAVQTWDIDRFLQEPKDRNTAAMQCNNAMMRQVRYMQALAHVLCTGQGVVTIRSPWSDSVFAKAMQQSGYISSGALEAHTDRCLASLWFYLRPHLIIYLDAPVETVMQNIKNRKRKPEINSKALTEKYLSDISENYKRDYLAKLSDHSQLLIYDWSQGGDSEVVLDDIEEVNFDNHEDTAVKLADWRFNAFQWKVFIKHFTFDRCTLLANNDIMRTDVPELNITGNEMEAWYEVMDEIPDLVYDRGYNILKGDKDVWKKCNFQWEANDYVTPLMDKYYERKARLKAEMQAKA